MVRGDANGGDGNAEAASDIPGTPRRSPGAISPRQYSPLRPRRRRIPPRRANTRRAPLSAAWVSRSIFSRNTASRVTRKSALPKSENADPVPLQEGLESQHTQIQVPSAAPLQASRPEAGRQPGMIEIRIGNREERQDSHRKRHVQHDGEGEETPLPAGQQATPVSSSPRATLWSSRPTMQRLLHFRAPEETS